MNLISGVALLFNKTIYTEKYIFSHQDLIDYYLHEKKYSSNEEREKMIEVTKNGIKGFVDSNGEWLSRSSAVEVAKASNQLLEKNPISSLYSDMVDWKPILLQKRAELIAARNAQQ